MPDTDNPEVAHEGSDVNVRGVVMFAAGLVIVTLVVQAAMWLLLQVLAAGDRGAGQPRRAVAAVERRRPPEPRLEVLSSPDSAFGFEEAENLRRFRETEEAALGSYGWANQKLGAAPGAAPGKP
jgi:hypothetical protein